MITGFQAEGKNRKKEVAEMITGFQAEGKSRKKEVRDLLEGFKTEKEKMIAAWQAVNATRAARKMAKRREIMPKVEAEVKVRPVKEAVEEVEE
jgi:hypothetical protein